MKNCLLLLAMVALSFALTGLIRRYALARSLFDVPNSRSSHTLPTARGGGLAIVITVFIALTGASRWDQVSAALVSSFVFAGGLTALIGFLDDHGHIAPKWRLLVHFVCAAIALMCLGGLGPLVIGSITLEPTELRICLGLLFLVWMINLYNFMDGIDGLASVEAITCCVSASILFAVTGHVQLLAGPLLLASAVLGFLIWNFPPAKIFMGDAGSGFLGLAIGVLAVQSSWVDPAFFWAWCILLGVFVVDATYTLIRRGLRGARVYEAHRSHAYQFASRRAGAHWPVTVAVALINIFWLLPLAAAVVLMQLNGIAGVLIAYIPLLVLAICYRAGCEE